MEFYFDSARKTIIARNGNHAVGIRPNDDSIEFFTPEYRVSGNTGDLMFPGYILSPLQYSDITSSIVAFHQKYVTIEKVIKVFFGRHNRNCKIAHRYAQGSQLYPEIDNAGFLTFRLLTGELCRMRYARREIVPEWIEQART